MNNLKERIEGNKIIIALDGLSKSEALEIATLLKGKVWGFKVNDLIFEDSNVISQLKKFGNIFADVKLYDIPNTVGNSVKKISDKGADIITVHASGGIEMMKEAKKRSGGSKIIAVTILTSKKQVKSNDSYIDRLTRDALEAQLDGIVCSGLDLKTIARIPKMKSKLKIVPGIRPHWYGTKDDQKRVVSPREAIDLGADYLVIGRPIIQTPNPLESLEKILDE